MIEQNKEYELKYWKSKDKNIVLNTYRRFFEIVPKEMFKGFKTALDLGSGAYCGVFNEIKFPIMFAIDPLWIEFKENDIGSTINNVYKATGDSSNIYFQGVDCIFSINALDHSGDFNQSIENIYNALRVGGVFAMHVHLRTEKQLDSGHKMALYMDDIRNSKLFQMDELFFKYYDDCPFGSKGREISAVIGVWKK